MLPSSCNGNSQQKFANPIRLVLVARAHKWGSSPEWISNPAPATDYINGLAFMR